jgi:hypothetical protein
MGSFSALSNSILRKHENNMLPNTARATKLFPMKFLCLNCSVETQKLVLMVSVVKRGEHVHFFHSGHFIDVRRLIFLPIIVEISFVTFQNSL